MSIQSACHAHETAIGAVAQDFGRPNCPRCGSVLLVAEESGFGLNGCIRHAWLCDDCGHEFVTSIRLWRR